MRFDDTLRTGLSRILNVDLSNRQWAFRLILNIYILLRRAQ